MGKKGKDVLVQIQAVLRLPPGAKVEMDAHGMGSTIKVGGETYAPQLCLSPEHEGNQVLFSDKDLAAKQIEITDYVVGECFITDK